jgi:ammonium transporter, Amt family
MSRIIRFIAASFVLLFALSAGSAVWAQTPAAATATPAAQQAAAVAINTGDTAWLLMSAALVMFMVMPGLTLFYGGLVRRKNSLSILAQALVIVAGVSVLWVIVGYSLAFSYLGSGNTMIGDTRWALLEGLLPSAGKGVAIHPNAPTVPALVFALYQMAFACVTAVIVIGSFAERVRFGAVVVFGILWTLLVWIPVAHWVWSPSGFLHKLGALDFAGGTVVHLNAGAAALAAALVVGKRKGFGRDAMPPYNLALTLAGAGFLLVGWFGFNGGSAFQANEMAAYAILNTMAAAGMGVLTWMMIETVTRGYASTLGLASGALAGLVAITPAAGYVPVWAALLIGSVGTIGAWIFATKLKSLMNIDDSLDVWAIHGIPGIIGSVLVGVLANAKLAGQEPNLMAQLIAVGVVAAYSFIATLVMFYVLKFFTGVRVSPDEEMEGLDLSQHGESVEHL